jgi:hypothetical protein
MSITSPSSASSLALGDMPAVMPSTSLLPVEPETERVNSAARGCLRRQSALLPAANSELPDLADDLVFGDKLVEFLFGRQADRERLRLARRQMYHLATEVAPEMQLPLFKLGRLWAGRRSTLIEWVAEREASAARAREALVGDRRPASAPAAGTKGRALSAMRPNEL